MNEKTMTEKSNHHVSRRRWKVLLLAGAGFSRTETARILKVSGRTVSRDITALRGSANGNGYMPSPLRDQLLRRACNVLGVEYDKR
jgi:hypothetical protein